MPDFTSFYNDVPLKFRRKFGAFSGVRSAGYKATAGGRCQQCPHLPITGSTSGTRPLVRPGKRAMGTS